MTKLIFSILLAVITLCTTSSSPLPTGVVEDGHEAYPQFMDNAEAGFMQIVTIPEPDGMRLDDYYYLWVNHDKPLVAGHFHTYAVSALYPEDARTNMGCYETWRWDTLPVTTEGYGEAFCISDNDMLWLFDHGAYSLSYSGY